MSNDPRETAFEDCRRQILAGASLDEAIARYSQWADELKPRLEAALAARALAADIHVPAEAQARSKARFLAEVRKQARPRRLFLFGGLWLPRRRASVALATFFSLIVATFGTLAAAAQSLPGDVLYPVKIAAEQTRLLLVSAPAQRLELEQSFDRNRAQEVETLSQQGRTVEVRFAGTLTQDEAGAWRVAGIRTIIPQALLASAPLAPGLYVEVSGVLQADGAVLAQTIEIRETEFTGQLESFTGDLWVVSGLSVTLTPETEVLGAPVAGARVRVHAVVLGDGSLQARELEVLATPAIATTTPRTTTAAEPSETPEPEVTSATNPTPEEVETREPTRTPEPSETHEPTRTPEPTEQREPSRTPQPTRTLEPSRTPEPTEIRTETETPEPRETGGATEAPESTHTPEPSRTAEPSRTPEPTRVEEPSRTPEPTQPPEPTRTPEPTHPSESTHTPGASQTLEPSDTPEPPHTPQTTSESP